jgi:hypothetical protein
MAVYEVETDQGVFEVEVEDAPSSPSVPNQPTPQSFGSKIMDTVTMSAPELGMKAYQGATDLFNKGGEALAEGFATGVTPVPSSPMNPVPLFRSTPGKGVKTNPTVAGMIGGTVATAPDVAGVFLAPNVQGVAKEAIPMARRALGFSKGMLKNPFARGQATKAAEVALEEGVIGASPTKMFDKATGLMETAKTKIGETLKQVPADFSQAIDNLEGLKGQLTQGTKGGVYEATNNAITTVQQTLAELRALGGNAKAGVINSLKNRIGKSLNYLADAASQGDNKAIVNNLSNSIRDAVKSVISPEEFIQFLKNQRLFNAAELMQKGLNNEISSQMGNSAVSLPGMVAGAAMGNPQQAIAATGLFEAAKRGGAGLGANAIQGTYRQAPRVGYGMFRAGEAAKPLFKKKDQRP